MEGAVTAATPQDNLPRCPTGTLVTEAGGMRQVLPAPCKRWRCPNCGWRKARKLAERIMDANANRFITLTLRYEAGDDPCAQLDLMRRAWRNVWKKIQRLHRERAVGYVAVVELQGNGTPHLHIAATCPFISQRTLSSWWREATGSWIVDIRKVESARALSKYLAKYLTKTTQSVEHRRKWSQTRGFLPDARCRAIEPGTIESQFRWLPTDPVAYGEALQQVGYALVGDFYYSPDFVRLHGLPRSTIRGRP